jgi:ribonuclease G
MVKEILVSDDEFETRVCLLEDGVFTEYYSDKKDELRILNNIYKGKVNSILPGMQAAFVDIGLDRNAFLHISDLYRTIDEYGELVNGNSKSRERKSIIDLLDKDQDIIVQVDKEPMGMKGPRVTAYITLPGRYLVYMPTLENVGISRKIETESERKRLRNLVSKLRPDNRGFIVRTAAEGKGEEVFKAEIEYLHEQWEQIIQKSEKAKSPHLLHEDLGIIQRVARDMFTDDFSQLVVDSKSAYDKIMVYVRKVQPGLKSRVKLYEEKGELYEIRGIEKELRRAIRQKIWLKSGGHIVINETEALVSIDVNTGKYVGKEDPNDTILKTNLEAAEEVARQIRLRDLGGIIVIDFIDMDERKHQRRVSKALQESLKRDRSRSNILKFTELGLVEMTRQRSKPSLNTLLCQPCPYCDGSGMILSDDTIVMQIFRSIKKALQKIERCKGIRIIANDGIAERLITQETGKIKKLERENGIKINLEVSPDLHIEDFRLFSLPSGREIFLD